MVICTPSRLVNHLEAGSLDLENCNSIVLDEVDILLGEELVIISTVVYL